MTKRVRLASKRIGRDPVRRKQAGKGGGERDGRWRRVANTKFHMTRQS